MLDWKPNKTKVLSWKNTTLEKLSENILNSTGFFHKSQEENIPDILMPCINKSMPFYEEMYRYRLMV